MTQRRIYQNDFPYFITTNIRDGLPLFNDRHCAQLLSNIMFCSCRMKRYLLYAYTIMPDHVHLIIGQNPNRAQVSVPAIGVSRVGATAPTERCGGGGGENISTVMYTIKSMFYTEMRKRHNICYSFWHKRFYSRLITSMDYLENAIEYIRHNPIKENLPKKFRQRPYQYFNEDKVNALFFSLNLGKI